MRTSINADIARSRLLLWAGDHEGAASLAKKIVEELAREAGGKKYLDPSESLAGILAEQVRQVQASAARLRVEDMERQLNQDPAPIVAHRGSQFSYMIVRSELVVLDVRGAVKPGDFGWLIPELGRLPAATAERVSLLPGDNRQQEMTFSLNFGNCFAGQISFYSLGMAEGRFYDLTGYELEQDYPFEERAARIAEAVKTLAAMVFATQ